MPNRVDQPWDFNLQDIDALGVDLSEIANFDLSSLELFNFEVPTLETLGVDLSQLGSPIEIEEFDFGLLDLEGIGLAISLLDGANEARSTDLPLGRPCTPKEVAEWMVEQLTRSAMLYQAQVVYRIARIFGEEHVYRNRHGNPAISGSVLGEFRTLTPDVVWEPRERFWRKRSEHDPPGRALR